MRTDSLDAPRSSPARATRSRATSLPRHGTVRTAALLASIAGALFACGPVEPLADRVEIRPDRAAPEDDATALDEGPVGSDAMTPVDSSRPADAPLVDSGCPAPRRITPSDVPRGFLAARDVQFVRTVDGDTAHFLVAGVETVVRFIYVNAEETHGTETTQFGLDTARVMDSYLRPARLQIAPQAGSNGAAMLDAYGRTLALVFANGELVQARMTREGLSAYYTQFGCAPSPIHEALLYGEAEARANQRGIWAPGHPTDYSEVLARWIGRSTCRPNPYRAPYCR